MTYDETIAILKQRSNEIRALVEEDRCKDCGKSYETYPCGVYHMEMQGHKLAIEGAV